MIESCRAGGPVMLPLARVETSVRRRLVRASDAEERAEGVEGVEAAVEAEGELVAVRLEVVRADPMMDADGDVVLAALRRALKGASEASSRT